MWKNYKKKEEGMKKVYSAEEIIKTYRTYKKSGLQTDYLVFMGLVKKEPLPNTISFMGGIYKLPSPPLKE